MTPQRSVNIDEISAFCRRHYIRRLALFGSVLRDDFRPDSDVDVLVEFEPGHVPGLRFLSMEQGSRSLGMRHKVFTTIGRGRGHRAAGRHR